MSKARSGAAPGAWLEDLTWPEAQKRFRAGAVVVVPIGARSKEHGHHLPLKTDYLLARELGRRVAAALPVVVAPVIDFGYYPAFINYPGSQHLRAETFVALVKDLIGNLIDHGVTRIAIINTGVSTEAPLRIVQRDILVECKVRVACADIRGLGRATSNLMRQKLGGHGDEHETSMILAIEPGSVKMALARPDYGNMLKAPQTVFVQPSTFGGNPDSGIDYSLTGVRGDPSLATVAKGRKILDAMAGELVAGIRALFPEAFAAVKAAAGAAPRRRRGSKR
ncbi:MAG: creatininase family protein [Proteobacteria bacterium]|nr:creatininase family protein [Pseudomonadota bacterium]MBI3496926.1 creatininase family protein [Pseudomonadota bacterium]